MKFGYILLLLLFVSACSDGGPEDMGKATLSVLDEIVDETDENQIIKLKLRFSKPLETSLFVEYFTEEITAEEGKDYEGIQNGEIIFSAGDQEKEIEIEIIGDNLQEAEESFQVNISNPDVNYFNDMSITVTILDDDDHIGSLIIPDGYSTPTEYPGMTLVWSDEFQGTTLNEADWTYDIGTGCPGLCGWGNNELQYYQKENLYIKDNDYLVIQARNENVLGNPYTSSRIKTQGKQYFKYGRIDIRAVLPEGQGMWPAVWMMGKNVSTVSWPRCGEIDIMELVGHDPNTVHGTFHYGNTTVDKSMKTSTRDAPLGEKFSDKFHVFSIIWEEDKIEILLDDVVYNSINPSDVGPYDYPFNQEFYFIFNLAVGGDWPGSPNASTVFPQHMIVDYVRVFQ